MTQTVLAALVNERQRAIHDERARSRRPRLRRAVAAWTYAVARAVTVLAVMLDDQPGTVRS